MQDPPVVVLSDNETTPIKDTTQQYANKDLKKTVEALKCMKSQNL